MPQVQTALQERFATPVNIHIEAGSALEGQALFDAMESMRGEMLQSIPAASAAAKPEKPAAPSNSETFYGKPFKGTTVPMRELKQWALRSFPAAAVRSIWKRL